MKYTTTVAEAAWKLSITGRSKPTGETILGKPVGKPEDGNAFDMTTHRGRYVNRVVAVGYKGDLEAVHAELDKLGVPGDQRVETKNPLGQVKIYWVK